MDLNLVGVYKGKELFHAFAVSQISALFQF
jgi:hypothetical protein